MDTTVQIETETPELPAVHMLGSKVTGTIAAFAANQLAEKLYVKVVYAIRARKGS